MTSPTILLAPAAFKGTFGPRAVAEALSVGVHSVIPDALVLYCPVSDGGDGLLDVVLAPGALRERVRVTGPLGRPVDAELGWLDPATAIFASASACGLALLRPEELDPLRATSRGVGELIWEAVDRGAKSVVVGLGGSATVDGGVGAARGLGWTVRDAAGGVVGEGGGALTDAAVLDGGWGLDAQVVALADVTTPLAGPGGAAPIFAPQKGAGPAAVAQLAAGLDHLGALMERAGRPELAALAGGGAAGGLGAGLAFFASARLVHGADWVLERLGFDAALATADLVITAEGVFDRTSLVGKASGEVIRRAQAAQKRALVVAGRVEPLPGITAVGGDGRPLSAAGIAALAARALRDALGLPVA